jgi:hypothetical protein
MGPDGPPFSSTRKVREMDEDDPDIDHREYLRFTGKQRLDEIEAIAFAMEHRRQRAKPPIRGRKRKVRLQLGSCGIDCRRRRRKFGDLKRKDCKRSTSFELRRSYMIPGRILCFCRHTIVSQSQPKEQQA